MPRERSRGLPDIPKVSKSLFDERVKLSFEEAKERGFIAYWTGVPCVNGHLSHRYVAKGVCIECDRNQRRRRACKEMRAEALSRGVDGDIRRQVEERREQQKLERELDSWSVE